MKIRSIWFLLLLLMMATAGPLHSQTDEWYVIDEWSGLNLYRPETKLQKGGLLKAENVQFRRPGEITAMEGIRLAAKGMGPNRVQGIGQIIIRGTPDSSWLISAAGTYGWVTDGGPDDSVFEEMKAAANPGSFWDFGDDDTLITGWWGPDTHRADSHGPGGSTRDGPATHWRKGWEVWRDTERDTISVIADNSTFYIEGEWDEIYDKQTLVDSIAPLWLDDSTRIQHVKLDYQGRPSLLILQAGVEPVLYTGPAPGAASYFGVADTGTIRDWGWDTALQVGWVIDNSKVGVYDDYELGPEGGGYWLHLPRIGNINDVLGFDESERDSSWWGTTLPIDSNRTVITGINRQFRIYFRYGNDTTDIACNGCDTPGTVAIGGLEHFVRSQYKAPYQILSVPYEHVVHSRDDLPPARFNQGGRHIKVPIGTFEEREFSNVPHIIDISYVTQDSTLFKSTVDTLISVTRRWVCEDAGPNIDILGRTFGRNEKCRWVETEDTSIVVHPPSVIRRNQVSYLAIRSLNTQTATDPDSQVIWTTGFNPGEAAGISNWTETLWDIRRLGVPYASDGIVYGNRLYLAGDPVEPNLMFYSRPYSYGDFPQHNVQRIGDNADVFTGFALIYNWLVVFQRQHTWLMKGDPNFGGVWELALPDEGCIAPRSITMVGNKVVYLSEKGWRIFDGNNAQDFAIRVKPAVQNFTRVEYSINQLEKGRSASVYDPTRDMVWLSSPFGAAVKNNGAFLYNLVTGDISHTDGFFGDSWALLDWHDTIRVAMADTGRIWVYGSTDSLKVTGVHGDSLVTTISTGWIELAQQGENEYVRECVIASKLSTTQISSVDSNMYVINFYKDFEEGIFKADTSYISGIIAAKHNQIELRSNIPLNQLIENIKVEIISHGFNIFEPHYAALRFSRNSRVQPDASDAERP